MQTEESHPAPEDEAEPVAATEPPVAETEPQPAAEEPETTAEQVASGKLAVAVEKLADRAREASARPLRVMLAAYAEQALRLIDSVLQGLEDRDSRKKKE